MTNRITAVGITFIFAGFICLQTASTVYASEWQIVGPRALGMGGANVAVANDDTASYWNPAAFGFFKGTEEDHYGKRDWSWALAEASVGAQLHDNFGETLVKFTDIDFDDNTSNIAPGKAADFIALLSTLQEFKGQENQSATITAASRVSFQAGHFGLGANAFLNITADPEFDFVNIGPTASTTFSIADFTNPANLGCATCGTGSISLTNNGLSLAQANTIKAGLPTTWTDAEKNGFINSVDNSLSRPGVTAPADIVAQTVNAATLADAAVGGKSLSQNESTLRFRGIALAEVPLTYGHAVSDKLAIGGNLKYMKARVYDREIEILGKDFGDALDDALDRYEEKSNFGIDLGVLYRLGDTFRVGLVGRNLNAPEFGSIQEDAQVRTGIAYQPSRFLTLAADVDLTKNDLSAGSDLKSQNIGAGLEMDFIFLQLRGGVYQNLAENDIGLVYTAGIGVNLWLINIDIGAAVSKDKTNLDDTDIWEEAKAAFSVSMLF